MKRRKNGEGSWGTKTIKGVTYQYYRDSDNKYTYGKTINEVKEKIKKKKKQNIHIQQSSAKTIEEYMLDWLSTTRQKKLKQQTYDSYELIITKYLNMNTCNFGNKNIKILNCLYI